MVDLTIPKKYQEQESKVNLSVPAKYQDNVIDVTNDQKAGAAGYAGALATEVAIAESVKMTGSAFGPIGYIIGGLGGGAVGSIAAQRIIDPNAPISIGRVIADSFINLIPGSKITKGAKTIKGVVGRTAASGAVIGSSGLVVEKGVDEGRLPTMQELAVTGLSATALGGSLGLTGAAFNKTYNKIAGKTPQEIDKLLDPKTPPDVIKNSLQDIEGGLSTVSDIKKMGNSLMNIQKKFNSNFQNTLVGSAIKRLQINFVDDKKLALDLQDQTGGGQITNPKGLFKVTNDEQDYYMEDLLRQAVTARQLEGYGNFIKETNDIAVDIAKNISKSSTGPNISGSQVINDVNQYLRAKHSIKYNEENAKLFGQKKQQFKTVERIQNVINKRTGKPVFDQTGKPLTEKVKEKVYQDVDGASGMSTPEARAIIKQFEAKGLQDSYKVIIDRKKYLSKEILEQAKRGGLVGDALYKDLRDKYPDYVPLNRVMSDDIPDINTTSFLGEVKGTGIYKSRGSELDVQDLDQNIIDNLSAMTIKANANRANQKFLNLIEAPENIGVANEILKINKEGGVRFKSISPKENDATVLTIYDKGEQIKLKFKDADLAATFKGMPKSSMPDFLKTAFSYSRSYIALRGQLLTRFNVLEFPYSNKIRDMQETFVNNMAKFGVKKSTQSVNPLNRSAMKIIGKKNLGKPAKDAEEQRLYDLHDQFKADGGSTGGLALYSRDDMRKMLENLTKDQFKNTPKILAQKTGKVIDKYNEIFEDSSRFNAYVTALNDGKTRKQAAMAARNASFDPLKQGRYGSEFRSLFLFGNPAIQGTRNILRSMKKPKVFSAIMGGLTSASYILHQVNKSVDENYREKLATRTGGNYRLNKNFVFVTGVNEDGTLEYYQLPTAYPMIPFKFIADKSALALSGDFNFDESAEAGLEFLDEAVDAYNPAGSSLIPTPINEVFFQPYFNEDGLGRTIVPERFTEKILQSENVFDYTAETKGGELAMSLADTLRTGLGMDVSPELLIHYYEISLGGVGKSMELLLNATSKLYNGEKLSPNEIPLVRRFIGESYKKKMDLRNKEIDKVLDQAEIEANTQTIINNRVAKNIFRKYQEAEGNKGEALRDLLFENSDKINDKVLNKIQSLIKDEGLGITSTDKRLRNLSIDGRAKAIIKILESKNPNEASDYLQELLRKKILTEDTSKKIMESDDFKNLFLREEK